MQTRKREREKKREKGYIVQIGARKKERIRANAKERKSERMK